MDKMGNNYEECTALMSELIRKWEQMRPDEELMVIVLPKYDLQERDSQLKQISEMLLREKWETPKKDGLPRA